MKTRFIILIISLIIVGHGVIPYSFAAYQAKAEKDSILAKKAASVHAFLQRNADELEGRQFGIDSMKVSDFNNDGMTLQIYWVKPPKP